MMTKRYCEKCQKQMPSECEIWKRICKTCWKKNITEKSNIYSVMDRLGESSFANNNPKFEGVQQFYKKRGK